MYNLISRALVSFNYIINRAKLALNTNQSIINGVVWLLVRTFFYKKKCQSEHKIWQW